MSYTQLASIIGAVLAIGVGVAGMVFGWFTAPDGLGLVFAGLSILGVHYGGSVAGTNRQQ